MNIYSRIEPTKVLHIIHRKRDAEQGRKDLVDPDQFIQVATIKQPAGKTFAPHRHIERKDYGFINTITQESWVVISGLVEVILYDLDNTVLHTDVLEPGDCSVTLECGHNYKFLQDGFVYEFKTGPYHGVEQDKTMI